MPMINIRMIPGATTEQKKELIVKVTQVMVDVLNKDPEKTFVIIDEVPAENWGLGGVTVAERLQGKK